MFLTRLDIQNFAAHLRRQGRSAATAEKYVREADRFAAWLGDRPPDREAALSYRDRLSRTRPASGANGAVSALNRLAAFLGLDWRLKALPVQRRLCREESRELTAAEYRRLLTAAKAKKNERLLLVMESICSTGIRVSELRFFTVEAVAAGRAQVTNKGKTRWVYLPAKLCKLLRAYARERGVASGPVFVTRGGKPLDRSNICHAMKGLCREARVEEKKVFPHNLRHLFARTFYRLEKDIVHLADILGHSSVDTTRIYALESSRTYRKRLERLNLLL